DIRRDGLLNADVIPSTADGGRGAGLLENILKQDMEIRPQFHAGLARLGREIDFEMLPSTGRNIRSAEDNMPMNSVITDADAVGIRYIRWERAGVICNVERTLLVAEIGNGKVELG